MLDITATAPTHLNAVGDRSLVDRIIREVVSDNWLVASSIFVRANTESPLLGLF